ncbi:MAG TPA: PRC-barrel domain-containing protein [Acidimicrobiales bacterium]|nr:PRC-barrel domain-containing protein [Acidimicrobiales bacterium]
MAGTETEHQHIGAKVVDSRGHAVGKVANVFYDDRTLEPRWVAVNLGVLHRHSPLVPLDEAYFSDTGHLVVSFTEDTIKHAPTAQETAPTTREAEDVARHYGIAPPHDS